MKLYQKFLLEYYSKNKISLGDFEKKYFDNLPDDKKEILFRPERGCFHSILINNKITAGVAGVIFNPKHKEFGFFQIYIDKKYRGQNILKTVAELIFKKYKLKLLISTIKKYNVQSIRSHEKAGFILVDNNKNFDIRGYMKDDEVRYVYRGN